MIHAILLAFFLSLGARASSPRKKASPLPTTPVALPAWAAEVYSSNIVGYQKLSLVPGYNMVAVQFANVGGGAQDLSTYFQMDDSYEGYDDD